MCSCWNNITPAIQLLYKSWSCGLLSCVALQYEINVSDDHVASMFISHWRWRKQCPPKRRYLNTSLYGVSTQKINRIWIFMTVKPQTSQLLFTSNTSLSTDYQGDTSSVYLNYVITLSDLTLKCRMQGFETREHKFIINTLHIYCWSAWVKGRQ